MPGFASIFFSLVVVALYIYLGVEMKSDQIKGGAGVFFLSAVTLSAAYLVARSYLNLPATPGSDYNTTSGSDVLAKFASQYLYKVNEFGKFPVTQNVADLLAALLIGSLTIAGLARQQVVDGKQLANPLYDIVWGSALLLF